MPGISAESAYGDRRSTCGRCAATRRADIKAASTEGNQVINLHKVCPTEWRAGLPRPQTGGIALQSPLNMQKRTYAEERPLLWKQQHRR